MNTLKNQSSRHLKVAALLILSALALGTNFALCQTVKAVLNLAANPLEAQIAPRSL